MADAVNGTSWSDFHYPTAFRRKQPGFVRSNFFIQRKSTDNAQFNVCWRSFWIRSLWGKFKTKLSKTNVLPPVQSKARPSSSFWPASARFEPEENNPASAGPLICGPLK